MISIFELIILTFALVFTLMSIGYIVLAHFDLAPRPSWMIKPQNSVKPVDLLSQKLESYTLESYAASATFASAKSLVLELKSQSTRPYAVLSVVQPEKRMRPAVMHTYQNKSRNMATQYIRNYYDKKPNSPMRSPSMFYEERATA